MQQTGTLKKRRRRNLAKVNGLATIPYDETMDSFLAMDLFHGDNEADESSSSKRFAVRSGDYTAYSVSSRDMASNRRDSNLSRTSRVTRDPRFHSGHSAISVEDDVSISDGMGSSSVGGDLDNEEGVKGRTHFLDKYYMQRLQQLIWLGTLTGSFPWKWDKENVRIERWSPQMEKLWWVRWCLETTQTLGLTCFQVHMFLEGFKDKDRSNRAVFMSSFGALWYTYALVYNWFLYIYKERTRQYINGLLTFNHGHVKRFVIHLDDYPDGGHTVINLCFFSNLSQTLISLSLFLRMPFQPWYLFSYIYPKPWYWLIPGGIHEMLLIGQVIIPYLLISWIIVAHTNTVQFWLQEIHHNNGSDYTTDDLRLPRYSIRTYKALQILNKHFNECMAPMAIPLMKVVMATAMVPCGYVLIRSLNHLFIEEFPGILTYPFSILDCGAVGFVLLTMSAGIFDLGCSFIDSWSRTKSKDFRRVLMSCPTLKVWTGRWYVITISTTITFFKVIFDIITDCIITFP